MKTRRFLVLMIVVGLFAALGSYSIAAAQDQNGWFTVSSTCNEGTYEFAFGAPQVRIDVKDSDGTLIGTKSFTFEAPGVHNGTIAYTQTAKGPVTFYLYYGGEGVQLVNQVTVPINCAQGCDLLMPIPSTAVMGQFVADAPLYWTPGQLVSPYTAVVQGKTYLVIGQDASGKYRQIVLQCQFLWVPFHTVGPDPEPLWNSKPLPATIVE